DLCCPDGAQTAGRIEASRWPAMFPKKLGADDGRRPVIDARSGGFQYGRTPPGETHWWLNFAAGELFQHYADRCFAQDEIQVFLHPALASVREALLAEYQSLRVTDRGRPTPFLVTGAHRRIAFDTRPMPEQGRPGSLYGRNFDLAPRGVVLGAARAVEPPTVSDILVMEAPSHGRGRYTGDQIAFILLAAYTGFRAAVLETERRAPGQPCVIHTGFWGCGAYGGNHVLMTALQLIAARLARVHTLAYYQWDEKGREYFARGKSEAEAIETAAFELAVNRNPDRLANDMARVVEDMERARAMGDERRYLQLDTDFHHLIFEHAGNDYLTASYTRYVGKIAALRTHLAKLPRHTDLSFEEHRMLATAVRKGEMDVIRRLLAEHIDRTRQAYKAAAIVLEANAGG
ncbi:MAG: hypothetical protein CVU59_11855, partial [Deltaproteobacteria bacterium HGW-Deltaproteobacteria-17]